MTLREFIEGLRAMRNGPHHPYSWQPVRGFEFALIRTNEENLTGYCHCPITALAEDTTGNLYRPSGMRNAGKMLGLSDAAINHIVDAADCLERNYDDPHHQKMLRTLRNRICEALRAEDAS